MNKANILIVEDIPFWAQKIEKLLKGAGYGITGKVSTVEDAKASIKKNLPDLAILDIELSDSSVSLR